MDIFINWNDEESQIQLPILPDAYEISGSQNNTSLYVHNLGEINLKGKRGLYGISIESFFPGQEYDFAHGTYEDPFDYYIAKLKKLYEKNTTVHLIITETDINLYCTIESFAYGEEEKNGDVKYSLSFREYREIESAKRTTTKSTTSTYKWKKGDTWSKVVKKKLGSSKTWKTVRKSNKSVITKAKKAYKKKHPKVKTIKEATALIGYKVVIK